MSKLWYRLKLLYYLLRVSRNPDDTQAALNMGPCLYELGHIRQTRDKISAVLHDADFMKKQKLLGPVDLQILKNCPQGSLGHTFANHMLSHNLDPYFYNHVQITNDESYIMMRLRQTHDLWHVITGLSTSFQDELALQAFMFAQTGAPLSTLLIGGALFRMGFTNDPQVYSAFERINDGWQLGKSTKPLFSLDWEANWNTPLESLRAEYGIKSTGLSRPESIRIGGGDA